MEQRFQAIRSLGKIWCSEHDSGLVDPRKRFRMGYGGFVRHPGSSFGRRRKRGQKTQALGRSKGGFSTKIHLAVDSFGNPVRVELTGGEVHDSQRAKALIEGIPAEYVLADKGYDSNEFRQAIVEQRAEPVIPPRSNRKTPIGYDRNLYKERNLIERAFNKLKHYRKIATRYDKKAANFMGFIVLGSIMIHLR